MPPLRLRARARLVVLATGLALLLTQAATAAAAEAVRLNILFCFADDWGRYAGCYRELDPGPSINQIVRTPHIDRVAREGVRFRNAFVPAPSCTPCRSALLSGRHWWNTGRGAILQGAVWDPAIPSFPLLLRDSGYHIGKSYKVWSPGTPADAPFGGQKHAYEKGGRLPNGFSEEATRLVGTGVPIETARERIVAQVRTNFGAFLADRKAGQPLLYWFGPTTTHRTWVKGSGKRLWGIEPDSLKGLLPHHLPDVPEVREDVADYLGEVQAYDAYIGALLEMLDQSGEADRTLVVISGDHGMPGVPGGKCNLYDFGTAVALVVRWPSTRKGGHVVDDLVSLTDLAPTFLQAGAVPPPPGMDGRPLLQQFQATRSGQIDPNRTSVVTGRERHVGVAREGNLPYPMRALRTKDFLYVRNFAPDRWPMGAPLAVTDAGEPDLATLENNTRAAFPDFDASPTKAWLVRHRKEPQWRPYYDRAFGKRPGVELFDLRSDPGQSRNRAGDPALAEDEKRLAAELGRILAVGGDPRVTGDGGTFDRPPFTDPEPRR